MMKGETREENGGRAERDGDEQMMKRLRWSGREGEMEMTAEMITCTNRGGQEEARE